MNFISTLILDFENENQIYFDLLREEDFDFSSRNIEVKIELINSQIRIILIGESILNLKIASNAVLKSLEIITKTLNI